MTGRGAISLAVAVAVAPGLLAGCEPDTVPFQISLVLERRDEAGFHCAVDSCANIPMSCNASVMIRIADAVTDETLLYSCSKVEVPPEGGDLCSIGDIDLGTDPIPNIMVKVQVAVWPMAPGATDPVCQVIGFSADGKPDAVEPAPAIGGEAYFEVGSAPLAEVVLGCVNIGALASDQCESPGVTHVTAGVNDFDTNFFVSPTVASRLAVSVGEPMFDQGLGQWILNTAETTSLERTVVAPVPEWQGDLDVAFQSAACIQVIEDSFQTTSVLSCRPVLGGADVTLDGILVDKSILDLVQQALGGGSFPQTGVVLGRVLDDSGQPAEGAVVSPSGGATVLYLSEDMTSASSVSPTTSSGAFLSLDAPFDTTWTAQAGPVSEVEVVTGGRVQGKVSVILIELTEAVVSP